MELEKPFFIMQNSPVVIKNAIKHWKMLDYTKEDWCNRFKNKHMKFRQGRKAYTESPYWEYLCESKEITLENFFELSTPNSDQWLYFDYKYLKDIFNENETFIHEFNWADLGLVDFSWEESTLWIGNEGAHTPCHKDTYGCNFVAQLFGRKLWILIPPEEGENLKPVRVPYEESSVYSHFNFYAPDNNLLNLKEAYKAVLFPGDVLYVPRHWWHYVENLEPAISMNIWVPLDEDHETRLEESLVQYYISCICQNLNEEEAKQILNPNEYNLFSKPCDLRIIEKCLENYKKHKNLNKPQKPICIKNKFNCEISRIDRLCIKSFIREKCENYNLRAHIEMKTEKALSNRISIVSALINSYCCQSNLNSVKEALFERKTTILEENNKFD